MGMDARYYIDGFTEPAALHEDVIAAAKILTFDSDYGMYVSRDETVGKSLSKIEDFWNDGFCVIDSFARAYKESSREMRESQVKILSEMFPGRNIYLSDDCYDREDVASDLKEFPERFEKLN